MKKVILIGDPVSHSLSPLLHNHWLKDFSIDGHFEVRATQVHEIPALIEDLEAGKLAGINVTLPYKERVFVYLDSFDPEVAKICATNTLYIRQGKLAGKNTDPEGFIENLKSQAPKWRPEGAALVLGTGAAAKAAVYALLRAGQKEIFIAGRTAKKIAAVINLFPGEGLKPLAWDDRETKLDETTLLINATPLGLPGFGPVDFDLARFDKKAYVYDLVYGREKTEFLKTAEAHGLKTIDGLGMLIFQAIPAFETWFGKRPIFNENLLKLLRTKT